MVMYLSSIEQAGEASKLRFRDFHGLVASEEDNPTVTVLMASLTELERRRHIDLMPPLSTWRHPGVDGVWATKRVSQIHGAGIPIELFNCISHAHVPVQVLVKRFLERYSQDPWSICRSIGRREAKAYGYLLRQTWPKSGLQRLLTRLGLGEDTQTVWVVNRLKARAARQASLIIRQQIDAYRRKAPQLYEALCRAITEGLAARQPANPHHAIRLPHLRKQPAH
ncbi:MAG: hypothetical protein ACE5JL_02635 [Dehalococcoidia bacterium]